MSISERMISAGLKAQAHPLREWRSADEWRAITPGRWLNSIEETKPETASTTKAVQLNLFGED